jgi:hypothetical protein
MSKVRGKLIGETHGLTVTVSHHPAKTSKGKERLWIQVRQNNGKKWKVYESLAYARAVDIAFEAQSD